MFRQMHWKTSTVAVSAMGRDGKRNFPAKRAQQVVCRRHSSTRMHQSVGPKPSIVARWLGGLPRNAVSRVQRWSSAQAVEAYDKIILRGFPFGEFTPCREFDPTPTLSTLTTLGHLCHDTLGWPAQGPFKLHRGHRISGVARLQADGPGVPCAAIDQKARNNRAATEVSRVARPYSVYFQQLFQRSV